MQVHNFAEGMARNRDHFLVNRDNMDVDLSSESWRQYKRFQCSDPTSSVKARFLMVRSAGIASLICSFFGCIWILVGVGLIDVGHARLFWNVLVGLGVLMLITSILFIARPGDDGPRREDWPAVVKRLRIVNAVQWGAILVAILILNVLHRTALIPWVISIIVGIHFVPLGYILRLTSYKLLGISIITMDLAVLALPPAMRYGYAALGTGLTLLCAASFWILKVSSVWLRRASSSVGKVHSAEGR